MTTGLHHGNKNTDDPSSTTVRPTSMNHAVNGPDAENLAAHPDEAASQQWLESIGPKLLPPQCIFAVQRYDSADIILPDVDEPALTRAVEKRQREFSAGRLAASITLRKFGLVNVQIPVGENRNPIWPTGIVGSITHAEGLAVAVTARQEQILAVGLDLERTAAVKEELWPSLFTQTEINWLSGKPREQHAHWATIIFSAKESFYKMQYPMTGQWVDFQDAEVIAISENGEFSLTCQLSVVAEKIGRSRFAGHYAVIPRFTLTAIHLVSPGKADRLEPHPISPHPPRPLENHVV